MDKWKRKKKEERKEEGSITQATLEGTAVLQCDGATVSDDVVMANIDKLAICSMIDDDVTLTCYWY
ncbi:hypothetical protein N7516_004173 [Penicillium verrucosum]|uniref:uncharacterized protein n=1 Tax=Penicillium verrucosum TaxID=60171 RepID=UPI0025455833|nr:uncharacterized protein N7516_004173 [Penicillium verrucosum]KAJ5944005.1 hypothetical protein N7516_004173 [Penicillium verrucosum]